MPDNYPVRDGTGASETFASKLVAGVQYPLHLMMALLGSTPTALTSDGTNLNVHVQASSLPSGAATADNQDTANASLGQVVTEATAAATALGAPGDAAWGGSGSGALVAIAKYIGTKLEAVRALLAGTLQTSGVTPVFAASGVTAVTGTFAAAGQSAAFTPNAGRDFNITLTGTFVAAVQLERSFDGTNWSPVTAAGVQLYVWGAPASEYAMESEVGVEYRLNCTSRASGTVTYRISQ